VQHAPQNGRTGEWEDKPNFFDVKVWGAQGENAGRYLSKGRPVAIDGRLEWREWETQDGTKRQAIEIIADSVQFLGSRTGGGGEEDPGDYTIPEDLPVPAGVGAEDPAASGADGEDIPF
jgi:single-strand DNA-binding protein